MSGHPLMRSTLDGLPKQFVTSMRTLFDILDEPKTGTIRLADIESRWKEDESTRLPKGVVECLKKVTPPDGRLTFERFCAGLKICLLRNKNANEGTNNSKPPLPTVAPLTGRGNGKVQLKKVVPSQSVPPTVTRPLTEMEEGKETREIADQACKAVSGPQRSNQVTVFQPTHSSGNFVTATVRPNISRHHRALSMPLLSNPDSGNMPEDVARPNAARGQEKDWLGREDIELNPSRTGTCTELQVYKNEVKNSSVYSEAPNAPSRVHSKEDRAAVAVGARSRHGIMTVLHNWHMGMLNDAENKNRASTTTLSPNKVRQGTSNTLGRRLGSRTAFSLGELATDDATEIASDGDVGGHNFKESMGHPLRKGIGRRREPRRHTLANGIDYNMLKRMKQLEQEKDVLLQGLEGVDKARAWYLRQIISVQDKMKYIGQSSGNLEYSTEAHQERLNFQMAQIFEVNQHLSALVESSERGFPLHMNLAVRHPPTLSRHPRQGGNSHDEAALQHLKELNRSLSEEVSRKSERITQLEREKAALVRELFQARSLPRKDTDDTTLISNGLGPGDLHYEVSQSIWTYC